MSEHHKINSDNVDVVLGLPSLDTLRNRQKQSRLTILASGSVMIIGFIVLF